MGQLRDIQSRAVLLQLFYVVAMIFLAQEPQTVLEVPQKIESYVIGVSDLGVAQKNIWIKLVEGLSVVASENGRVAVDNLILEVDLPLLLLILGHRVPHDDVLIAEWARSWQRHFIKPEKGATYFL